MFIQHLECVTVSVWFGSNLPEVILQVQSVIAIKIMRKKQTLFSCEK
jgi:hypothetical protein